MSTFHGRGLQKKFGLKLSRDKMGLWSGTQVYTCLREELARVVPSQGSEHEDFPFLTVEEIESVEGLEGGIMKIVARYAGALGLYGDEDVAAENIPEYNLEVTTSDGRRIQNMTNWMCRIGPRRWNWRRIRQWKMTKRRSKKSILRIGPKTKLSFTKKFEAELKRSVIQRLFGQSDG